MNSNDKKVRNIGIAVFLLMVVTSVLLRGDAISESSHPQDGGENFFQDMLLQEESIRESGDLGTDESTEFLVEHITRLPKNVTVTVNWDDENNPPAPRLRRYENQPDQFSLRITAPDGNYTSDSATNQIGETGTLSVKMSLSDEVLNDLRNSGETGWGVWRVEVTLVDTGMWTPILGPGVLGLQDNGNSYSISIDYEYYDLSTEEES